MDGAASPARTGHRSARGRQLGLRQSPHAGSLEDHARRQADAARVAGRDSVFVRGPGGIEVVAVEVLHRDGRAAYLDGVPAGAEVVSRGVLALKAVAEGAAEPGGAQ